MSDQAYHLGAYSLRGLAMAERALFQAWDGLEKFHQDLVVIGGLAVYHHTRNTENQIFPTTATLDVDMGISLGTDAGLAGTVRFDLLMLGYQPDEKGRLFQDSPEGKIYLDFLTEHPPSTTGTRNVSDVAASICPGINRALATREKIAISGTNRFGDERIFQIPVCGIGALLILKLNAFANRKNKKKAKDAFDILVAVSAYSKGAAAAVDAFHAERTAENPAFEGAVETLVKSFREVDSEGPILAHQFCYGEAAADSNDFRLRTNLVSIAKELLSFP